MSEAGTNSPPPYTDAAPGSNTSPADAKGQSTTPAANSSETSVGGLNIGNKVLGFGYGSNVSGAGIKVGPLMLGLVDAKQTDKENDKPAEAKPEGNAA